MDNGRVKRVYVQVEAGARIPPEDFEKWYVRNQNGEMVPFASFFEGEWFMGSPRLERYNGVAAMEIVGQGAAGISSGEAMAKMEELPGSFLRA